MRVKYRTKYGNIKVRHDGHVFDSKKEARRYQELCLLEAAGKIQALQVHPKYELIQSFRDRGGHTIRRVTVTWDFAYTEDGRKVVEDVKSPPTRKETAYNLRRKMFLNRYRNVEFREVT